MNNQAAQTIPLPPPYSTSTGFALFNSDQMRQYARDYAAALAQTAGVAEGFVMAPREPTPAMVAAWRSSIPDDSCSYHADDETWAVWCSKSWSAMLAAAPAASGGEDKGDPVCHEDDGCPTEGAVLKRFWRSLNTDDTKQLMAFYGVADVAALIEQQVQHVQSLQIKLKAHEPKRDQFPKSPREG